jgi:hypothetical protein
MAHHPTVSTSQAEPDQLVHKGRLTLSQHHGTLADTGRSSPASEHHYAGPSRVNWLCNSPTSSPTTPLVPKRPPSALALGRSLSSPSPLSPHTASSRMYRHPALSSNHSLQLDMSRYGCSRSAQSAESATPLPKPLTPIIEQVYHPAEQRRSPERDSPMTPGTPGTPASFDQGAAPRILAPFLFL